MENSVRVARDALLGFVERLLTAEKLSPYQARLMAESLVEASLRGVDSHGVHLLPYYIRQFRAGNIDLAAAGRVVSESGACLLYDGEHGLGQQISAVCCDHAVRLARLYGMGLVLARRSNHFGAAAFWGQRISSQGMIGIVMCNASPSVPPWQGREGRVGTNPICVSVPSTGRGAWLLDMATTTVAMNKIVQAAANGRATIPPGWAVDRDGVPTTDTQAARRGWLMPLGGYKGSGLNLMVEILCAVLSGGVLSTGVGGLHILDRKMNTSQLFLAVDVTRFLPLDQFQARMEQLVTLIKSTPPARGYGEVLVAGDPESRAAEQRLREGIPVDLSTWERLGELAAEHGLPLPPAIHQRARA
jgi:LDH2 family malate/lactate/ureidoglycolate dehydrogenase